MGSIQGYSYEMLGFLQTEMLYEWKDVSGIFNCFCFDLAESFADSVFFSIVEDVENSSSVFFFVSVLPAIAYSTPFVK